MPSSLTEDRSSTLGYLPLPTSVGVRYGQHNTQAVSGFSRRPVHHVTSTTSSVARRPGWTSCGPDFPRPRPLGADLPCPFGRLTLATASPHPSCCAGAGLSTCSPSPTLFQPRLRSRLTLGRLPLPRNPQASGVAGSKNRHSRYSFRHSHLWALQRPFRFAFTAAHNAPLP